MTSVEAVPLQLRRDANIVTLQFNRPQALNAIDIPMARALLAAARDLAADRSVRAVVLCGTGKGFMAGGDLASLQRDPHGSAAELLTPLNEAIKLFDSIDAPVIAKVHGVAAGAGMSLMLQADFVIAAEGTRFNLAYVNIGASCDGGASWALPRLVGLRRALAIALLSDTIEASEALQMGLINEIVAADTLDSTVAALARRLAQGPTRAFGHIRRLMRSTWDCTLAQQLDAEAHAFRQSVGTDDFHNGVEAFFTKQMPTFSGH